MPTFTMMVGVAGSGKSTIATQIAQKTGAEIVSSDAIRGEIYGDENCQASPAKIFEIVHNRVHKAIREQRDVIMDATNLSCKRRMAFLNTIAHFDCIKQCIIVIATPEDIEHRMKARERKVPMEVVHKQIAQFQCPHFYEGWDDIRIEWTSQIISCLESCKALDNESFIPHDNPHHSLSVRQHMVRAEEIVNANPLASSDDEWIARIHDWGKPRVKTFTDRNGNPTNVAHYRNHQNVSAYYSLVFEGANFDCPVVQALDEACIIQWHMEHYLRQGKALEKLYEMIGPELSRRLHILEEADKAAH